MERFATNKNGNIDSGTEVLANNITFLQQAKELAISNLFGDLFVEGILNTGEASTMFELTSNGDGTFSVSQGTAYKRNVSVEPMIYERISIEDANEEYNSANPSQTTFDGVDQNIPTPKSTGCKNITIPNDGVLYYVDLRYLCVCDNGNTGDGLGLNNYSIAKNQITTSTDQRKRFYKWVDGYEIVLVETTGDIQGICLGTVEKNGVDVDITNDGRAKNLLIESRVIMDYFTSGKGIIVETNQETNQTQLTINVDDITTEIDDNNKVRVTKDGLYPYTKFAINSGFINSYGESNVLGNTSTTVYLNFGGNPGTPLVVSPAYNDRYVITVNTGVTEISNVINEIQQYYSETAEGKYTICINNTNKDDENVTLDIPKLEIMKQVVVNKVQPTAFNKGTIWYDLSESPYKAKWYNGSSWEEYQGVPLGVITISVGSIIDLYLFPFNYNGKQENNEEPREYFAICDTAKNTTSKEISIPNFYTVNGDIPLGTKIRVKFNNGNVNKGITLKINTKYGSIEAQIDVFNVRGITTDACCYILSNEVVDLTWDFGTMYAWQVKEEVVLNTLSSDGRYRIYRSGFVEQNGYVSRSGGSTDVALPIPMSNSSYCCLAQYGGTRIDSGDTDSNFHVAPKNGDSTTTITIYAPRSVSSPNRLYWEVKGYGILS